MGELSSAFHSMLRKFLIFCLFGSGLLPKKAVGYPVILLVLDGFLPSYFSSLSTPTLDSLCKDGVRVSKLQPEFPASRDPFLVSLLTGRHSEDHGVFARERYSARLDNILSIEEADFWNKSQELGTLWDLVAKFRACNWPHAQHLVKGGRFEDERILAFKKGPPASSSSAENRTSSADASISDNWSVCVEATAEWLTKAEDDVQLVSLYIDEPGTTAEIFGPDSVEVTGAVAQVDSMVGQLVERLRKENLDDRVNLVIVSTPGYVPLTYDHLVDMTALVKSEFFMSIGESPVLNIKPLQKELMVYEELKKGEQLGRYKVHIKDEFPRVSHYADNEDVQELIVVAEEGFAFSHDMKNRLKELDQIANRSESLKNVYGISGFNNTLTSMQTFLVGWGPDVANGGKLVVPKSIQDIEAEPIRVVDVFALLCHILDVEAPQAVASDKKRVNVLLRYPSDTEVVKVIRNWMSYAFLPENAPITIAIGVCALLGLMVVSLLFICIVRRCCWRRKDIALTTGYRYTQVMSNRRHEGGDVEVQFEGDKQGLLTEVNINEDDDYDERA